VMYVVNGHWTFALDAATGQQIWRTPVEYKRRPARVGQSFARCARSLECAPGAGQFEVSDLTG
jgi:glucose dehydrogenase